MACDGHNQSTEGHPLDATISRRQRRSSTIPISCRAPGWPRSWRSPPAAGWGSCSPSTYPDRQAGGANAAAKVPALVAGMIAGADSSTTWTCCATAGWPGCSTRSGPRRRWARSCAVHLRPRPPTRRRRRPAADPPGRQTPLLPGADQWPSSTSTTPCADLRLRQARRRARLHAASKASTRCSGSSPPRVGAGDRRRPATQGTTNSARGARNVRRRRPGHRAAAGATGVLIARWTRPTTATTSSPRAAGAGPGSPSPPG